MLYRNKKSWRTDRLGSVLMRDPQRLFHSLLRCKQFLNVARFMIFKSGSSMTETKKAYCVQLSS